jgi:ABC-type branched-subunit amino acid transport system ATPase component
MGVPALLDRDESSLGLSPLLAKELFGQLSVIEAEKLGMR